MSRSTSNIDFLLVKEVFQKNAWAKVKAYRDECDTKLEQPLEYHRNISVGPNSPIAPCERCANVKSQNGGFCLCKKPSKISNTLIGTFLSEPCYQDNSNPIIHKDDNIAPYLIGDGIVFTQDEYANMPCVCPTAIYIAKSTIPGNTNEYIVLGDPSTFTANINSGTKQQCNTRLSYSKVSTHFLLIIILYYRVFNISLTVSQLSFIFVLCLYY